MVLVLILVKAATLLLHHIDYLCPLLAHNFIIKVYFESCEDKIVRVQIQIMLGLLTYCNFQWHTDSTDITCLVDCASNQRELRLDISHDYTNNHTCMDTDSYLEMLAVLKKHLLRIILNF